MSLIIRPTEVLREQVIKMQKEAAEEIAKKGTIFLKSAAGAMPPNGPSNKNNVELFKKIAKNVDFSSNGILMENLGKNLNKIF